jgi:hypothetical protein
VTPANQREALALLAELWSLSPDVRLGQLLSHLGFLGESHIGRGLGYIDDDELIAVMYRHKSELLARLQGAPQPSTVADLGLSLSGSPVSPTDAPATD